MSATCMQTSYIFPKQKHFLQYHRHRRNQTPSPMMSQEAQTSSRKNKLTGPGPWPTGLHQGLQKRPMILKPVALRETAVGKSANQTWHHLAGKSTPKRSHVQCTVLKFPVSPTCDDGGSSSSYSSEVQCSYWDYVLIASGSSCSASFVTLRMIISVLSMQCCQFLVSCVSFIICGWSVDLASTWWPGAPYLMLVVLTCSIMSLGRPSLSTKHWK